MNNPKKEEWMKEFEKRRIKYPILRQNKDLGDGWLFSEETSISLKQFISTLLSKQKKDLVGRLENLKETPPFDTGDEAYNQGLDHAIKLVKES